MWMKPDAMCVFQRIYDKRRQDWSVRKIILTIAIDGLSGCGKSTLARMLAERYGLAYIDSGALYRLTAFLLMRKESITIHDLDFLNETDMLPDGDILYRGHSYTEETALSEVVRTVSSIAQIPIVRQQINEWIRRKAGHTSIAMDGRDIGSIVLPDASVKIYLTCSVEYRVNNWKRIRLERYGSCSPAEEAQFRQTMEQRDHDDLHRRIAPLVRVPDALFFDTEQTPQDEIYRIVCNRIDSILSSGTC